MHGIGHTVRTHRQCKTQRAAMGNRFSVANAFFRVSPGGAGATARRPERPPRGPPQFREIGEVRSRLQVLCNAGDRNRRAGQPPRSLCHGHDRLGREAQSSCHQPIRYKGSGPHACRARLGRTKGPARLPAAGNRCCEEDRKVFPQAESISLGENLAHNTGLQAGQVTQRATWLLQSNMRRSQVARSEIVRCRGWLYRQEQGQPGLWGRGLSSRPFSRPGGALGCRPKSAGATEPQ